MRWFRMVGTGMTSLVLLTGAVISLAGEAGASTTTGPLHAVFSTFDSSNTAMISCPPGGTAASTTCYLVGAGPGGTPPPGQTAYPGIPSDFSYEVVPVTNGQVGQPVLLPSGDEASSIVCPSGPTCVAVGRAGANSGAFFWIDNGKVTKTLQVPDASYWYDLACDKSLNCVGVGENYVKHGSQTIEYGMLASEVGGSLSEHVFTSTSQFDAVACPSASLCLAAGASYSPDYKTHGVLVDLTNGQPGPVRQVAGTTLLSHLACGWEQGVCLANGTAPGPSGSILPAQVTIEGPKTVVSALPADATDGSIVCPTVGRCLEFGVENANSREEHGFVDTVTGGKVNPPVTVSNTADIYWLACPAAGSCVGLASYLHGAHGDFSEATFTLSYAA
jgi:hypothetical protein